MPETSSDLLTAALADRYRVERELGRGGMATVYLDRDLRRRKPLSGITAAWLSSPRAKERRFVRAPA